MTTTTSSEKKKKTRELPNLTECHCCHLRVDLAKSSQNNKLQILYSEWRIVLLCNKCLARVESTELCSYCFNDSSSGHCFSCRQCRRRVHRDCDSEYRSAAVWSGSSSAAADEVSVCADCWVSESLARWRRSRNVGSGRKSRADLGLGRSRVLKYERKCDPNSTDSSTEEEAGCLRLDGVEEEEEEEIGDDEPLKEGQGSCSNGVESESPPSYKQDDCNCIALPKVEIGNAKLDPYYFKYRRRSSVDLSLLTYKRRSIVDCFKIDCPLLTYKRRGSVDYRFMFTYKRRRNFDQSMLTYKRRRPEIVYASSKMQLEGQC
ncbi:putative chromatin regulator PHD family [Rosa chinensis]|uniref:Putative chromatin regulator PHD family n=1 Tax=Rosa chinensis TaxID=74649 RepID=A0A2P6R5A0_ROSCH|nr:uncharacterized protein LOC112194207 [Rosa chinensis]XP_024190219.1 uncharacterized protein LOC112194207 [Rosa chinensis]XP_024190220.1 uncharacterized protein LOC112194207 [Rosa chinensis]XP_024190221.1 uncharacterized protein LOC112194207 [Rosa chinensis]PRQ41603.1 putative chromatin regulator PHD family [Rosa chinensis]